MNQPTELQLQTMALATVALLTREAIRAGAPQDIAPVWSLSGGLVDGHFSSADDSALQALTAWRKALGKHRVTSYTYTGSDGPRHVWKVAATVSEVSVHLAASVPAAVAAELLDALQAVAA